MFSTKTFIQRAFTDEVRDDFAVAKPSGRLAFPEVSSIRREIALRDGFEVVVVASFEDRVPRSVDRQECLILMKQRLERSFNGTG